MVDEALTGDEKVDSPSHYSDKEIEPIVYIESICGEEFFRGNIIKYISRYKSKNGVEDLKKAEWYLKRLIQIKQED